MIITSFLSTSHHHIHTPGAVVCICSCSAGDVSIGMGGMRNTHHVYMSALAQIPLHNLLVKLQPTP